MYQMEGFIDMDSDPRFYQIGLCSVSYIANEHPINHFHVIIKDLSISFSRVITVQDFNQN